MSVIIKSVESGSLCEGLVCAGDILVSINAHEINDVLDYMYHTAQDALAVRCRRENGEEYEVEIKKGEYDSLGLEFETYLMDKQRSCSNQCIFCFIDQLPKDMRKTLYFKDDDARMSFLRGNYITLTNLSEKDVQRIIELKISPVNVSVQTTNPELRKFMMGNRRAGESLGMIDRFAKAGIVMNCQVVVCKGVNDEGELKNTLSDLISKYPSVASISVVPVGITRHREGLHPLEVIDAQSAADIIHLTREISEVALRKCGSRIVFLADEFFLRAGQTIPENDYYEEYPQLENGVGLIALMKYEFNSFIKFVKPSAAKRKVTVVTGVAAAPFIQSLVDKLKEKWYNLECKVIPVPNRFFGETVDVAGLVVGQDIERELSEKDLGEEVLIPVQMLRYDKDRFLDDVTVDELQNRLHTPLNIVEIDGGCFINAVLGQEIV